MTKTSVEQRRGKVIELLETSFAKCAKENFKTNEKNLEAIEPLFQVDALGLREILLVIVVARLIDMKFQASKALYECNPRALYEGPIREVLLKYRIPNGKSGPLNIAKSTEAINEHWAARRRHSAVAMQLVEIVKNIEKMAQKDLEQFFLDLSARFLKEASRIAELKVDINPQSDPNWLYLLLKKLIEETPDAGNTPQRIIGLLLEEHYSAIESGILIRGHQDRASVTSTTSKKAGDIAEELADGTFALCYEITVKKFNHERLIESWESIQQFNNEQESKISEVLVICRKQDAHEGIQASGSFYLGKIQYQNLTYHFIEIFEWIISQILRMTPVSRMNFLEKLQDYINNPNTSEKVKTLFMQWSREHSSE